MTWGAIRAEAASRAPGRGNDLLTNWIQRSYREILDQRDWQGLHADGLLQVVASYVAGTVALTKGSTAVTGTGTIFTIAMTGRKFRNVSGEEWYTFTFVSATSGTLDRAYEGATEATAAYWLYQDRYTVPAVVKLVETMGGKGPIDIGVLRYQSPSIGGTRFWTSGNDTDDAVPPVLHTVELWPYPDASFGISYRYLTTVFDFDGFNTSDSPLPWVSPDAIIAGVMYRAGLQDQTEFMRFLSLMERVDNQRIPPMQMQMADRFTAHRAKRL